MEDYKEHENTLQVSICVCSIAVSSVSVFFQGTQMNFAIYQ